MAIAVALTTQCPYCLDVHRKASVAAGATQAELAETVFVATALRGCGLPPRQPPFSRVTIATPALCATLALCLKRRTGLIT